MAAVPFSFSKSSILPRTSQSSLFNYHHQQLQLIISLPLGRYQRLSTFSCCLQRQPLKEVGLGIAWDSKKEKGRLAAVQASAVRQLTGSLTSAEDLRFGIVVARFNEIVTKALLEGALDTFKKYSVKEEDIDVVWVPGSFEIGVVAEKLGKSRKYQAIVCIGAVVFHVYLVF